MWLFQGFLCREVKGPAQRKCKMQQLLQRAGCSLSKWHFVHRNDIWFVNIVLARFYRDGTRGSGQPLQAFPELDEYQRLMVLRLALVKHQILCSNLVSHKESWPAGRTLNWGCNTTWCVMWNLYNYLWVQFHKEKNAACQICKFPKFWEDCLMAMNWAISVEPHSRVWLCCDTAEPSSRSQTSLLK